MSMKMKAVMLTFSAGVLLFTVAGRLKVRASSNNEGAYRQIQVYSEVLSRVRSEYVEEPNTTAVTDGALHGLLDSLDPNSSYLTPDQYKEPAALRRALALPVQDGFRRGGVYLAPAQRRQGPLQLPRNRLGNEGQDGATRARVGAPDRRHPALGGRPAQAVKRDDP